MWKRRRAAGEKQTTIAWPGWIVFALGSVVAIWAVETSDTFRECIETAQPVIGYFSLLNTRRVCLAEFTHANGEIIIAFILLLSTILMWIATRDAARAAKVAADHIPNVERAVIYGGIKFGNVITEDDTRYIVITVSMANYGKTPGFIQHIETGSAALNDLQDEPLYTDCFAVMDLYFPENENGRGSCH
jgi:hypothetical protein